MPEIAEVETVRNVLKKQILNKKIKDVNIIYSKMIENDKEEFKKILINNSFKDRLIFLPSLNDLINIIY